MSSLSPHAARLRARPSLVRYGLIALFGLLGALLVQTASPSPARADAQSDRRAAEKLSEEGIQFAKQKRFAEAVERFEAALKLYPHPVIMHNLGRAHEELGDLRQAYEFFARALKDDYSFATDGRARLNRIARTLAKTHARVLIRATPSRSRIELTMPDSTQETFVSTPLTVWIPAGKARVQVSDPEFKRRDEELTLKAGEEHDLHIVLEPLPRLGFLRLSVNVPGARVILSGRRLGETPLQTAAIEAGVYQLEIDAKDYEPWIEPVTIEADAVTEIVVGLEPVGGIRRSMGPATSGTPSWVGWTLIGGGVAVAAGGAGAFAKALSENDAISFEYGVNGPKASAPDSEYRDAFDSRVRPWNTASTIMFVTGGVMAVTGAVLLIASPERELEATPARTEGVSLRPDFGVGPGAVQVGATLRF